MKEIRFGFNIFRFLLKDSLHYPSRVIVETMGVLARCGILLLLYSYVFRISGGSLHDTTFMVVAWSMFFYFASSVLRIRGIASKIMNDVKSGHVEMLFSKPVRYILYRMWWQVGSGLYPFLVIASGGTLAMILLVGVPESMTSGMFLLTFLMTFLFGVFLSLCLYTAVGLFAFWMEDISSLFMVIDKAVMVLGGSYLPIALFPNIMYTIAVWSPFGASMFVTHTVYDSWAVEWYKLVGIQVVWLCVFVGVVYFMFRRAEKRVFVNGG